MTETKPKTLYSKFRNACRDYRRGSLDILTGDSTLRKLSKVVEVVTAPMTLAMLADQALFRGLLNDLNLRPTQIAICAVSAASLFSSVTLAGSSIIRGRDLSDDRIAELDELAKNISTRLKAVFDRVKHAPQDVWTGIKIECEESIAGAWKTASAGTAVATTLAGIVFPNTLVESQKQSMLMALDSALIVAAATVSGVILESFRRQGVRSRVPYLDQDFFS